MGKKKDKDLTQRKRRGDAEGTEKSGREESTGEREDEEIAFAGNDDGEGAAVGRDGEIAEAEAVKDGNGLRLRDGNVMRR